MYANINNCCMFEGRLTKDPVFETIPLQNGQGLSKVKFSIAVDRNLSKKQKDLANAKGDPTADYVNFECTGAKAETVANYFKKGKPIKVSAVYRAYSYTNKQNEKVYAHVFDVVDVGFVLSDNSGNGNNSAGGSNSIPNDYFGANMGMTPIEDTDMPF